MSRSSWTLIIFRWFCDKRGFYIGDTNEKISARAIEFLWKTPGKCIKTNLPDRSLKTFLAVLDFCHSAVAAAAQWWVAAWRRCPLLAVRAPVLVLLNGKNRRKKKVKSSFFLLIKYYKIILWLILKWIKVYEEYCINYTHLKDK